MTERASSELIRVGQMEICFTLPAQRTGGRLTMFEFRVPVQARVPVPHSHVAYDETIYGLEGVLKWTVEGRNLELGPGDTLFIHRGTVHCFENVGTSNARQLSVITPGILGPEYFRELAAVLNAGEPPNLDRIMDVMQKHGLQPVLPSPPGNPPQTA
jgi:quercetin dioxygenase-like cupin family protein